MAENLQDYDIGIEIGNEVKLYKSITKIEKRLMRMQKKIYDGATRSSKYSFAGGGMFGGDIGKNVVQKAIRQQNAASKSVLAERLKQEQKLAEKVDQYGKSMVDKAIESREKKELKRESDLAKIRHKKLQEENKLRERQQKFSADKSERIYKAMNSNREIRQADPTARYNMAKRLTGAKSQRELNRLIMQERNLIMDAVHARKLATKQLQKQSFLQQRISASAKQMAGSYISAFAVAGTGVGVVRIGQDFEAVNNTMLAVSANAEAAGENFKFVRDEAFRLGLGLKESAKGFAKMIAARGDMTIEQTKKAFSGLSEMSTLLGLSAEESGRATNALQQMMSKGVVSAEELKLQMGEVLPNAIPLMAMAAKDAGLSINGTVKEMMDLQQKGQLISSKVLPFFAKRMSDAARANGGLNKALESNRVAMNRMVMGFQEAGDTIFKSGLSDGLTDLFNTSAESLRELNPLFKSFGKILGSVFHLISRGIDLITPPLRFLGTILDTITDATGKFSFVVSSVLGAAIFTFLGKAAGLNKFFSAVKVGMLGILAPVMKVVAALALLEELLNKFVFKDKVGYMYDPRLDPENKLYDKKAAVKKQSEATFTNPLMNKIVENDYLKGTGFSFENLKNFIMSINKESPSQIGKYGLPSSLSGSKPQQIILEGNVYIDGEQAGRVIGNTESMKDATGSMLLPILSR